MKIRKLASYLSLFIMLTAFWSQIGHSQEIVPRQGVVYLDFWASWCPPCRQSFPWLEKIARNPQITVIAVNVDESTRDYEKFLSQVSHKGIKIVRSIKLAEKLAVPSLPYSFVFKDGRVIQEVKGFSLSKAQRIEALLTDLTAPAPYNAKPIS